MVGHMAQSQKSELHSLLATREWASQSQWNALRLLLGLLRKMVTLSSYTWHWVDLGAKGTEAILRSCTDGSESQHQESSTKKCTEIKSWRHHESLGWSHSLSHTYPEPMYTNQYISLFPFKSVWVVSVTIECLNWHNNYFKYVCFPKSKYTGSQNPVSKPR